MKFGDKELFVIDIAEKLFAEKGFEGTSVRDIAKEACGNVSMVSYYFGSKENLLIAVLERRTNDMKIHLNHLLDNTELTNLQKINIIIDEFLQNMMQLKNFQKILIREELFNRDPKIYAILDDFKKNNKAMFFQILRHGIEVGEFKKDVEMELLMAMFIGTVKQMYIAQDAYLRNEEGNKEAVKDCNNTEMYKKLSAYIKQMFKVILANDEK